MTRSSTCLALIALVASFAPAQSGLVDAYHLDRSVTLPTGTTETLWATASDGRIVALADLELYYEDAVGAGTFTSVGFLPTPPAGVPMYPSFLSVSPNGTNIAFGDGSFCVGVFDATTLLGSYTPTGHYDSTWIDDNTMAMTYFGGVSVMNTALGTMTTVISNIGGASGGVCFDGAGNLYTANGYQIAGPSATGDVKVFDNAAWTAALTSGTPLDFEATGTVLGTVLSGGTLGFDADGNLCVGGGDLFGGGEGDYVAVISAGAVAAAVSGTAIDITNTTTFLRLDPDTTNDFNFYGVRWNGGADELLIGGGGTLWGYSPATYPGTGEDLTLDVGINGATAAWPDVHSAGVGDTLDIYLDSPNGGFDGAIPGLVAQLFITGNPPHNGTGFVGLQVDPSAAAAYPVLVLFDGAPLPVFLAPGGMLFSYNVPFIPGNLSVMLQGVAVTTSAGNGFFGATNGQEVQF